MASLCSERDPTQTEAWDILPPGSVLPYALDEPLQQPLVLATGGVRPPGIAGAALEPVAVVRSGHRAQVSRRRPRLSPGAGAAGCRCGDLRSPHDSCLPPLLAAVRHGGVRFGQTPSSEGAAHRRRLPKRWGADGVWNADRPHALCVGLRLHRDEGVSASAPLASSPCVWLLPPACRSRTLSALFSCSQLAWCLSLPSRPQASLAC